MTFKEYQAACKATIKGMRTMQWELAPGLTVPVHVREDPKTGVPVYTVLVRKELDAVMRETPLGLFYARLAGARTSSCRQREGGDAELKLLRDTANLLPFADRMSHDVRKALLLPDFVEFCQYLCSEWGTLGLNRTRLFSAVRRMGLHPVDWFDMWQAMLRARPRIQAIACPPPAKGAIATFADYWSGIVGSERQEQSSSEAAERADEEAKVLACPVMPQVLLDHSVNDDVLGKRLKHNVTANASIEYSLTFEADETTLKRVVQLLEVDQYDALDGCNVHDNFVTLLMRGDILNAYPAKGNTDMIALDRMHATVDAVHEELCDMLSQLQVLEQRRMQRRLCNADGVY